MKDIRNLPIPPLPALPTQRRIASILGAYDDLVAVNRRRIALLEEMARRLFEEWFVHLRFPGRQERAAMASRGTKLPTGWEAGTAGDLIDFDPTTTVRKDRLKPFIPMSGLSTSTSLIEQIEWKEGNSGAKFRNGDTLFARITPCLENGKTGLVRDLPGDGLGFGSTEFIVMRGRWAGPAFCYELARQDGFREHARRSMSGATGRQRARTESVRTYPLAIPPDALLEQFERIAFPLLELSGLLGAANARLRASRGLLLPRLLSGDAAVASAERELEAVA
jgi:type I restriction enzyme, S subunit